RHTLYICDNVTSCVDKNTLSLHDALPIFEKEGFEFMTVNSKLKKDPQFVCLKSKKLHFVVVRAVRYPDNPSTYDVTYMEIMKQRSEEHTSELQSRENIVCRLLLEKKKIN